VAKPAGTTGPAGPVRLVDVLAVMRQRIWFLSMMTAAVFAVAAIVAVLEQPVYRAYVTMAPAEPVADPDRVALPTELLGVGLAGAGQLGGFQGRTSLNEAFAILSSRTISRRFIETEGLMQVLFADLWDPDAGTWAVEDPEDIPTVDDAIEVFQRDVRFISRNQQTGFMRVNIEWSDPVLAAEWANRIVELTDEAIRDRDIREARASIRFLRQQASEAPLESVRRLIYTLIESYSKTVMVASVKEDYAFDIIDPAVAPRIDEPINMPLSFKLSLALLFALGCSLVYIIIVAQLRVEDR